MKTKPLFILIATALLGSMQLQAQDNSKIGLRLGSNLSKVSGVDSKFKFGINADAFVLFDISNNFRIQTELGYARQGFRSKSTNSSVRLHYINLAPAIAKIYLTPKLNIEAGPKLGYLISSKGMLKKSLKKFDFGLTAGLAYSLSNTFELNARYNYGLRNLSKVNKSTFKNKGFQIGLAIRF